MKSRSESHLLERTQNASYRTEFIGKGEFGVLITVSVLKTDDLIAAKFAAVEVEFTNNDCLTEVFIRVIDLDAGVVSEWGEPLTKFLQYITFPVVPNLPKYLTVIG